MHVCLYHALNFLLTNKVLLAYLQVFGLTPFLLLRCLFWITVITIETFSLVTVQIGNRLCNCYDEHFLYIVRRAREAIGTLSDNLPTTEEVGAEDTSNVLPRKWLAKIKRRRNGETAPGVASEQARVPPGREVGSKFQALGSLKKRITKGICFKSGTAVVGASEDLNARTGKKSFNNSAIKDVNNT